MSRPPATITLVHLTDTHLFASTEPALLGINTWQSLQAVLTHLSGSGLYANATLATGDLSQDSQTMSYQQFLQAMAALPWPLHGLPGNHDHPGRLRATLQAAAHPIIDYGAWRLVMLDTHLPGSEGGHLAPEQLDLLHQAAQVGPDRHVLLAMHHHPVPMGCAWLDSMLIDNADALLHLIDTLPTIRAMVWGHVHQAFDSQYLRSTPGLQPLRMLATPSTCFQFLPHSSQFALDTQLPGYRLIHLHTDGHIDTELIRIPSLPPAAGRLQYASVGY